MQLLQHKLISVQELPGDYLSQIFDHSSSSVIPSSRAENILNVEFQWSQHFIWRWLSVLKTTTATTTNP